MSVDLLFASTLCQKILDAGNDACCIVESESLLINAMSANAQLLFGYTAEELIGQPFTTLLVQHDAAQHGLQHVLNNTNNRLFKTASGNHFHSNLSVSQLEGVAIITFQHSSESTSLLPNNEISVLKSTLNAMNITNRVARIGSWRVDLLAKIASWSQETAMIHGFDKAMQFAIDDAINFYAPKHRELIKQTFYQCANNGSPFDEVLQLVTKDNKTVWVRSIGEPEYNSAGEIVAVRGAFQDIDDLVKAKLKVNELEASLANTLEQISDAFFTLDRNWCFTYTNSKAERLLKMEKEALIGNNVWELFPEAVGSEYQTRYEYALKHNETVRFSSYYEPLNSLFDVSAYPTEQGLAVYFKDLTAFDELKKRSKQAEKIESEVGHLEALFRLTGGVAHDFNNLLTVIMSNAEYLYDKMPTHSDLKKNSQLILSAAQKSSNLTQHLLAFSSKQILSPEEANLSTVIHNIQALAANIIPNNISINLNIKEDNSTVFVDKNKLQLCILNIIINACEAMPNGGSILIEVFTPSELTLLNNIPSAQHHYIQIKISDTGSGMNEYVRKRAFEPYFTTKDNEKNHGLGLSTVYGFAQQSSGAAFIESGSEQGCHVSLLFPCLHEKESNSHTNPPAIEDKTVLLVEDDELLMEYLKLFLTKAGYQVDYSSTADGAVPMLEQKTYQIVISDIITPGIMDGVQLSILINEKYPKTNIILSSGYNNYSEEISEQMGKNFYYLAKPYKISELLSLLKKCAH